MKRGLAVALLLYLAGASQISAAAIDDCRELVLRGDFAKAIEQATQAIEEGAYGEAWPAVKAEAELATGQYQQAAETLKDGLSKYTWSVKLRVLLREALRYSGEADKVPALEQEIAQLVDSAPWRYTDAEALVLLGRLALDFGGDAKLVQEAFFERARRNNPLHRLPRLALGQLALDKRDFKLAADIFREAVEAFPDDPDMLFGLSEAIASADPEQARALRARVAAINSEHIPLLIQQIDHLVAAEQYREAEQIIDRVLAVNSSHPLALAYGATIAHLQNDPEREAELYSKALATWPGNPEVDHVIGRELSQKYRFAEGAQHQQQALDFDPDYLPAKKQLAQDLLRLGREDEGWQMADAAYAADQYDVAVYNLLTLRDELQRFTTLEQDGFIVRMEATEAAVYGHRVLDLLHEARQTLCPKYGIELTQPVIVEIFPEPADFAVRTFGMPGVSGYLGVCFGNVITANSPASQTASPSNWESVLWHEFAHVVTLNRTLNRMPRWLSEGISVYEERQRDSAWGQRMTPAWRQRILAGQITPIGELSGAFLNAGDASDIAFAYYQSSLVVEHLVNEFGLDALNDVLEDLAAGLSINEALQRHTASLDELDESFATFARDLAAGPVPESEWTSPDLADVDGDSPSDKLRNWIEQNPNNYAGLKLYTELLLRQGNDEQAEPLLRRLIEMEPRATGANGPLMQLARLFRKRGDTLQEREILTRLVEIDDSAHEALLRLLELDAAASDWQAVQQNARRLRAIDPLIPQPHRFLADASEKLGDADEARMSLESLLALGTDDSATLHYRLARSLAESDDSRHQLQARRHILQSLEQAPRYRDALRLLLQIVDANPSPNENARQQAP